MSRQLIFSVTRDQFTVETYRASGPGGQNRNKVETAVRITHPASGAIGQASEERSQYQNRCIAFHRLAENPKFKLWVKRQIYDIMNKETIEEVVARQMAPDNILVEVVDENGKWIPWANSDNG